MNRSAIALWTGVWDTWHLVAPAAGGNEGAGREEGWVELPDLLVRFC